MNIHADSGFSACSVLTFCNERAWKTIVVVTYTCRTFLWRCLTLVSNVIRADKYCTLL